MSRAKFTMERFQQALDHAWGVCGGATICRACRRWEARERWFAEHPITSDMLFKGLERQRRQSAILNFEIERHNERRRRLNEMKAAKAPR